jgi:hypothetical protein
LKGYGTIARRCHIFHTIGRAGCGDWPHRTSRSLAGRIRWCVGCIKRRFAEQGCFFQFIPRGSAGIQPVKCQKSMGTCASNRSMCRLSLRIGIPEIIGRRVDRLQDRTPTKSERHGHNETPCPHGYTCRKYIIEQVHKTARHFQPGIIFMDRVKPVGFGGLEIHGPPHLTPATLEQALLRSTNYSDTDPEPKTRPNAVIRIFDLSLYYAGLNRCLFREEASGSPGGDATSC